MTTIATNHRPSVFDAAASVVHAIAEVVAMLPVAARIAHEAEVLYSMSDAELANRGLSREAVAGYLWNLYGRS